MLSPRLSTWFVIAFVFAALSGAAAAQSTRPAAVLDPNVATEKELLSLPHMNSAIAKGLIEKRPFSSIGALDAFLATSLTPQQRAEAYQRMFVAINLNTATDAEILLVPGVGRRMLHEFKEYRPYRNMAQFRREIGKYVDDEELARLERYVTLD